MTENCIFCQIVAGSITADILYTDEQVTAFRDQHPAEPVHILIVPNRHITSLNRINEEDEALMGHLIITARRLAEQQKVSQSGYRVVINTGADAGQSVFHIHVHLMGGRPLSRLTR